MAVEFVKVAQRADLAEGRRVITELPDGTRIAVFSVAGQLYCIDDVCTHDGGPVAEGPLDGYAIECPRHGARFDIRDGRVLALPAVLPIGTYEVKVEGEDVLVATSPRE